jgi:hypothetical protein
MALLTVTVNNPGSALDKRFKEVALISRALELAVQSIRAAGGAQTSGNIMDTGQVLLGSWNYTPQASN